MKAEWNYSENDFQRFYDAKLDGHDLLVFENRWQRGLWMGAVDGRVLLNKTKNDRIRRRHNLPKGASLQGYGFFLLGGKTPEYMMKKVEYCSRHGQTEISQ